MWPQAGECTRCLWRSLPAASAPDVGVQPLPRCLPLTGDHSGASREGRSQAAGPRHHLPAGRAAATHPLQRAAGLEVQADPATLGGVLRLLVQALPVLVPGAPARPPLLHGRRRHGPGRWALLTLSPRPRQPGQAPRAATSTSLPRSSTWVVAALPDIVRAVAPAQSGVRRWGTVFFIPPPSAGAVAPSPSPGERVRMRECVWWEYDAACDWP